MDKTKRLTELSDCYRRSGGEVEEMIVLFEAKIERLNGIIEDMPLIQRCRTCDDADSGTIYCRKCYYKLEAVKDDAFDVMKNQLQAIIDKLPKDADGLPVVPGQTLWVWVNGKPMGIYAFYFDNILDDWWLYTGTHHWKIKEDCYSTEAAVEAAKGKT